jgi:hypothetical protein
MEKIISLIFIVILCTIYYSCKDKSTQPTLGFEGITETLNDPTPIGNVDPDDWKPMMECGILSKVVQTSTISDTQYVNVPTCTKIYPAYPNPSSTYFMVQYSLSATDSVYMTVNDSPTHIVIELVKERHSAGMYSVQLDASSLSSGIYRVYISVFRLTDVLHSYGDIKIVK